MNRNTGRFIAGMHFDEWDGATEGKGTDYLYRIEEFETNSEVYIFEPSWVGEPWTILVLRYTEHWEGLSNPLKAQCESLRNLLKAKYLEMPA